MSAATLISNGRSINYKLPGRHNSVNPSHILLMEVCMFALKVDCTVVNRAEISGLNAAFKDSRGSFVDNVCIYIKLDSK